MSFRETTVAYLGLRESLSRKRLTPEQFAERVKGLTFQHTDGTYWRIDERGQGWWTREGADWVRREPPARSDDDFAGTLSEFCSKVFVPALASKARSIAKSTIITAAIAWFVNFIYSYTGTYYTMPRFVQDLGQYLGVRGNLLAKIVYWVAVGGLIHQYLIDTKNSEEGQAAKGIGNAVRLIAKANAATGVAGWPGIIGGAAVAVLLCTALNMKTLGLVLGGWLLTLLGQGYRSFFFIGASIIWRGASKSPGLHRRERVFLALAGSSIGALVTVVLPGQPKMGYVIGIICAVLAFLTGSMGKGHIKPPTVKLGRQR